MKNICLLGASGSIGTQTVDVISRYPKLFNLVAVSVNKSIDYLEYLVNKFPSIKYVCIGKLDLYDEFKDKYPNITCFYGDEGLNEIATVKETNYVVNALVGFKGLMPTILAIRNKKNIGLANKETLVACGHIINKELKENNVKLYPIDSEHSAIFQCLKGENKKNVEKLILTASGGSFRDKNRDELNNVNLEEALNHPNWKMGTKITIDSATMVNKGLEIIEAHWLFNMPYDKIDVVIHKESIIHSMIQTKDGAVKAQLGTPDMRIPIMYALSYPNRLKIDTERLDFSKISTMNFKSVDINRYPAIKLAYEAGRKEGSMPTVFNASNEVAVDAFINKKLRFILIEEVIERTMKAHTNISNPSLEEVLEVDEWAREYASRLIESGEIK